MKNVFQIVVVGFAFVAAACSDAKKSGPADMAVVVDASVADLTTNAEDDLEESTADLSQRDLVTTSSDLTSAADDLSSVADLLAAANDLAPTNTVTWTASDGLPSGDCAPWTLLETADTEVPMIGAGVLVLTTSPASEFMFYNHGESVLTTPATLVIEARMRFVGGTSTDTARTTAAVGFRIGPNRKRNTLFIGDGEIFVLSNATTKGNAASVATKDGLHTYRIEVDTTTGAMTVYRDGVSTLTGTAFEVSDALTPTILFGDTNGNAGGTTEWERVSHNAHTAISCP